MSLTDEDQQWINERLQGLQTRLLTAFHDWASPRDARMRSHSAAINALDLEIEELKQRVEKLENRPHA